MTYWRDRPTRVTRADLARALETMARRQIVRVSWDIEMDRLDRRGQWSVLLAECRSALTMVGAEDHFWKIARGFGLTPTVLHVHKTVTCASMVLFTKEDTTGGEVTCPTCLAGDP